ncbi:MAG: Spo0B domain-containing protein [Firmicutes bacterium]|nr:Spo0B domain-containing protein [Bacillota bacterium]
MHDVSESIAKLFNLCRHEIINRLQVISGLAQLNKTEKLQSCIREVSEEVHQLGRLASCGDPRLALLIYEASVMAPENSLSFECNGTMPVLSPASLTLAAELLDACKEYLLRETSVPLTIMLRGGDAPSVSLRFSATCGEQPDLSCFLENAAGCGLAAAMADEGGILTLLLDKQ